MVVVGRTVTVEVIMTVLLMVVGGGLWEVGGGLLEVGGGF